MQKLIIFFQQKYLWIIVLTQAHTQEGVEGANATPF